MHYAHLYYTNPQQEKPWLLFPDRPAEPAYSDFMYFSFTIAVASQTADVEIASSPMRRAVLMQSVVSFVLIWRYWDYVLISPPVYFKRSGGWKHY